MHFAIIVSNRDPAGRTIKNALLEKGFAQTEEHYDGFPVLQLQQTRLYTLQSEPVFFAGCDNLPCDFLIFATRHQSKKGTPALCAHAVGNWGTAELGGKENQLGVAPALYLKRAVQLLEEKNTVGYDVFQEATHHGPLSTKPILFIEIGSSVKEYESIEAGMIIADTIIELLSFISAAEKIAIGIGGLRHTPSFKKIQLQSSIAIGHICPKYNLPYLTKDMLLQAIKRTSPNAELILLDWKGLGEEKERIKAMVDDVAQDKILQVMKTQEF